jgi:hypothetical protein
MMTLSIYPKKVCVTIYSLLLIMLYGANSYAEDVADTEIELLVFYQPSYFEAYGQELGLLRIESMITTFNEALTEQGAGFSVTLVDFTPMINLSDSLPYNSEYDDDGNETVVGASSLVSVYIFNPGYEEHDTYEKYAPDLVMYLRDHQGEEGLNSASQGGTFSTLLAQDTEQDDLLFIHNIGHNLGANHEYSAVGETEPEYAHAYECGTARTIMYSEYSEAIQAYFSSPTLQLESQVCGDDYADNLTVITDNAPAKAEVGGGVEPWGAVTFEADSYSVNENETTTITIKRDGDLGAEATFKLLLKGDGATYGEDYENEFIDVAFEIGLDNVEVELPIIDDDEEESDESLTLSIAYPYMLSLGDITEAAVTIVSDEVSVPTGTISFAESGYEVEEGSSLVIELVRSDGDSGSIEVNVSTQAVDAIEGVNYTGLNDAVIFADGQTSATVSLLTLDDGVYDTDKTLTVELTSDDDANIGDGEVTISIVNIDDAFIGNFTLSGSIDVDNAMFSYSISRSEFDAVSVVGTGTLTIGSTVDTFDFTFDESADNITGELSLEAESLVSDGTATLEIFVDSESQGVLSVDFEAADTPDDDVDETSDDSATKSAGGSLGGGSILALVLMALWGGSRRDKVKDNWR